MSDPFFAPVKKNGAVGGREGGRGGSRGGSRGGRGGRGRGGRGGNRGGEARAVNPAPKKDTGKKDRATTSMAGKRKRRGDSDDEVVERRGGRKTAESDSGDDEIGAGGIDDMDLEFGASDDEEEDEALMNETAAQKRLRLAKNYIDTLQHAGGKGPKGFGYDRFLGGKKLIWGCCTLIRR